MIQSIDLVERPFDDARLLDTWDSSAGLPRPWAELNVLAGAFGRPVDELARLPLGRRDRMLLELHEWLAGRLLDCESDCPACGERLELALDTPALRAVDQAAEPGSEPGSDPPRVVRRDGWEVRLRPADSTDVAAALDAADPVAALVERCIVERRRDGIAVDGSAALPAGVLAASDACLAELDPGADLQLELTCPACQAQWLQPIDPATFVLRDIEDRALRLLAEVDALARTYGWREGDVLALSPDRRRRYLELALG